MITIDDDPSKFKIVREAMEPVDNIVIFVLIFQCNQRKK